MDPGSDDVMGRARLSGTDPNGEPAGISQHLDVGPMAVVLAREPQVGLLARCLGMQCAGVNQGPIQAHEGLTGLLHLLDGRGQARAALGDDARWPHAGSGRPWPARCHCPWPGS